MSEPDNTPKKWRFGRGILRLSAIVIVCAVIVVLTRTSADDAFRWFSGLGFPDVKGQKFIRANTTGSESGWDDISANHYTDGFLLSESNRTFALLTKALFVRSFPKTPPGTETNLQVGYETLDLATEAKAYLAELRNPPTNTWRRFGEPVPERVEAFVMAWACDRNGQSRVAKELFRQASLMCEAVPYSTNWFGRAREQVDKFLHRAPQRLPLIQQIQRDIGYALMWRTTKSFGDPAVSRKELLRQLQSIVSNYPASEYAQRAKEMAEILQRMIKEDEAHVSPERAALLSMPTNQQVAEWIFRLRDQNGQQWSQPGSCDIFMDYRGTTNTPAHELVRIGYLSVPQLIAVIDDRTLTRSVGYYRDFYFSHAVLTVGDCAMAILQRLSGKSFRTSRTSNPPNDGGVSPVRKAVAEWWAEFQAKGERQYLMDAVASGDDDALAQAKMLAERFPTEALAAMARGAQASQESGTRIRLVGLAATLKDHEVTNFLNAEMHDAPGLATRVAAARALRGKGERNSIATMLREWERWDDSPKTDGGDEALIEFLAGTDSPEAIVALGRDLRKRKVDTRLKIVESLGRGREHSWSFGEGGEKMSPVTLIAIEAELVKALDDLEERMGMSGTWNDKVFSNPRPCDFAGHFLAKRWPERYVFDLGASLEVRERQRIECQNAWRRAHGPGQPVPESH